MTKKFLLYDKKSMNTAPNVENFLLYDKKILLYDKKSMNTAPNIEEEPIFPKWVFNFKAKWKISHLFSNEHSSCGERANESISKNKSGK